MSYIIDGHNLIPHVQGLSLKDLDDEMHLVQILQDFCRIRRTNVDVFFDNAPYGSDGNRSFGRVKAFFVREGTSADAAIQHHLLQLGNKARNMTVVSSDRAVQSSARSAQARVIGAAEFADLIDQTKARDASQAGIPDKSESDPDEVAYWLEQFQQRGKDKPGKTVHKGE